MNSRPCFLSLLLSAAAGLALPAAGQEPPPAPRREMLPQPDAKERPAFDVLHERPLTIRVPEAMPLQEFARTSLAGPLDGAVNVFVDPRVADLEVPPIEMKDVSFNALMDVLAEIVGFRIETRPPAGPGMSGIVAFLPRDAGAAGAFGGAPGPVTPAHLPRPHVIPLAAKPELRVISLAELEGPWEKLTPRLQELVTAVLGDPPLPQGALKFSPQARLLLVRLEPQRADEVVQIVRGYLESARTLAERTRERTAPLRERIIAVDSELRAKAAELGGDHPTVVRLAQERDELEDRVSIVEAEARLW